MSADSHGSEPRHRSQDGASDGVFHRLSELIQDDRWARRICLAAAAGLLFLAYLPVDVRAQQILGVVLFAAMLVFKALPRTPMTSFLFISCGAFLTLRYLFWRTGYTVVYQDFPSFVCSILLYTAEVYGIVLYLVSLFINSSFLNRKPVPLTGPPESWPTVDIMVPSYNEPQHLLEVTLIAALQVDYPKDRFNVYLLDDGGTTQKRGDADPGKAQEAAERHRDLQIMCAELGAYYVTRDQNLHAKAGNINSALEKIENGEVSDAQTGEVKTPGELILILDADHVPSPDFLRKTVGWFQRDPKLFLMQTPHFFLNPDPIEKNLQTFQRMPSENEMFYRVIQRGLDFWNCSFFCGSAAVLRREYLMQIGGISGISITEDAETALALHGLGYHSAYLDQPLIAGLQPETFGGFVVQRTRWAQGMVQIFLLRNPLRMKGLTLPQRLGYFNSSFFWFFAYSRAVFLVAPAFFLIFGLQIYRANLQEFLGYAVPHVIGAVLAAYYLFGHVRWTLFSELYETMQSIFCLRGLVQVFINPHSPSFGVTPKGEHLENNFISPFAGTFYTLTLIMVASLGAAVYRYYAYPLDRGVVVITGVWALLNILLLVAALGAVYERAQRRDYPRVKVGYRGRLRAGDSQVPCRLQDISVSGVGILVPWSFSTALEGLRGTRLEVFDPRQDAWVEVPVEVRNRRYGRRGMTLGMAFGEATTEERFKIVRLIYGDSRRWNEFLYSRDQPSSVFFGIGFLLSRGIAAATNHLLHIVRWAGVGSVRWVAAGFRRAFALDATGAATDQSNGKV